LILVEVSAGRADVVHHQSMGDLIPLFLLAALGLLVAALYDCVTASDDAVRSLPKPMWVLLILVLPVVGAIMWFKAGRPAASAATSSHPAQWVASAPVESGPLAPDDDPEFLRTLSAESARRAERQRRDDEERLRQWEADLRQREERLRKREDPPTDEP
jgi:hypothetical protein